MPPEALHQQPGASGRVDDDADPESPLTTLTRRDAQADTVGLDDHIENLMLFEHLGAALLGMAKQDFVESLAQDLERLRRRSFDGGRKIGILLERAVERLEASPPLLDESGRRDRVANAERAQDLVGPRQLRFADVEARESLALQHDHAPATPDQLGGGARTSRSPTDHRDIVGPPIVHAVHGRSRTSCITVSGPGHEFSATTRAFASELRRRERVALTGVAGLDPALEPAHALGGAARG